MLCAELLARARIVTLSLQNFPVEIIPSHFEETLDKAAFPQPWRYVEETALGKAKEVAGRLGDRQDWAVVIGADTVVVLDNKILEKPGSDARAREMLTSLSGRQHTVFTGLALVWKGGERVSHEATLVSFAPLTPQVIDSYLSSGEPLDKAGAYGIQGEGGTLVARIEGDYFNVVGLPLHRLCCELSAVLPTILNSSS
ncbi:dTTP/UTP pyrophosphatase [Geodia barretti]|uniref:dTTP/UTP pyrophosphatase n=2 Tax=Geodia barretti TaxID=519541 RepID=A0AA35W1W1_GEOBA|nr:dTTP/UTP pyrophosphatase [Geodia barretti]